MAEHISQQELTRIANITDAPARTRVDRNFGLPTGLYVATAGLYLAFLGLMTTLFGNPALAIPLAVMAGFIVMFFGLCGLWTKMQPENPTAPMSWGQLSARGIQTLSGPLTSSEAAAQVLILPVLIMVWGFSIAVIVALT